MSKLTINMVETHYAKFEVEAEDIETAKDNLILGVDANLEPLWTDSDIVRINTQQDYEDDDVVTEFYDDEWNEI
tara:strand:- start:69 stop:290 length:222 start_codon:yes stop_codon:yes gene_type:complete